MFLVTQTSVDDRAPLSLQRLKKVDYVVKLSLHPRRTALRCRTFVRQMSTTFSMMHSIRLGNSHTRTLHIMSRPLSALTFITIPLSKFCGRRKPSISHQTLCIAQSTTNTMTTLLPIIQDQRRPILIQTTTRQRCSFAGAYAV